MNRTKLPFLTIIFCLFHISFVFSQEDVSDAVYLRLVKEYTLNPDGSVDYRYQKELKLQTYRSFHNLYGETFIVYHPGLQDLKINASYTVMADGRKILSPPNAFNEVLPSFCSFAPTYNYLREMVITHTGTERNAMINLDYTLHSKKDFFPAFFGNEVMAEYEPVRELVLRVRIPAGMKLNYQSLNGQSEPIISEESGLRVYSWKSASVPAISPEEFQPGGYALYPRVIFSIAPDRESVYATLFKQPAFSFGINGEMKQSVSDLVKGVEDEMDIALKLQEKVVNEFRLWPVPLKNIGFKCLTAIETWKSNGGTSLEKAVLLVTLLKEAGTAAEPVLVVRNNLFSKKIASLLDIDDILVKVILKNGEKLYLSVSALNAQSLDKSLPGRTFISLTKDGKVFYEQTPDTENKLLMKGDFIVNEKKELNGEVSATFINACDPWFAMLRDKAKAKGYIGGGLTGSDLKELKVITTGPVEGYIKYTVQKEKPFHQDTNFYSFLLPQITNGVESWNMRLMSQKRKAPVEIPFLPDESYKFSFILPAGMKLFTAERKTEIENEAGAFIYEVKKEGEKISVIKSIRFNQQVIDPALYARFKTLMDNWNDPHSRELVFVEE
jgi:hypothetical protein